MQSSSDPQQRRAHKWWLQVAPFASGGLLSAALLASQSACAQQTHQRSATTEGDRPRQRVGHEHEHHRPAGHAPAQPSSRRPRLHCFVEFHASE